MIKVVGRWEQGWITPLQEYDLWQFPLRDFEVDEWYMFPVTGMAKKRHVTEVHDLEDVLAANPDMIRVFVDENGKLPLADFEHPENALYICGTAGYSPMQGKASKDPSVRIQTPAAGGMLWPHQAMGIVLYDRMLKDGRYGSRQ